MVPITDSIAEIIFPDDGESALQIFVNYWKPVRDRET